MRYELAVEQDISQLEETKSLGMLTSMARQLNFRLDEKDFVPCFVRVSGKPYLFYNKEGFRSGALTLGISAPSSFISESEFKQALDKAQADLARRTGITITFSDSVPEKKSNMQSQDFLVNDPLLGRSFDAGLVSSNVSLQGVFQGMPDVFSKLSSHQKLNLLIPLLERETLRTILFPGIVKKGFSLMGPAPETSLSSYKEDLAKRGEWATPDFTTYFALDPIDYDVSTLIARSVSSSYGHGLPE